MPGLDWTLPAQEDLRNINRWLAKNRSPAIAARTLIEIRTRSTFLEDFPHGGRPGHDATRVLRVHDTPYLILYRLRADIVEILRIRHEREDWQIEP